MTDGELALRPATQADAPLLTAWDAQPHVKASDPDTDGDWAEDLAHPLPGYTYLLAEVAGTPIGCVLVLDPAQDPTQYWGPVVPGYRALDTWIGPPEYLGRGYGTRMLRLVVADCFADPTVRAIWVDPLRSNTRAHRFYQRLGFVPVGERVFGEEVCLVHVLERP
ncbi:MAG: GNAT family N-acetyltransferase [Bacteroidia bacterium]|nr:GNAT family N-acetyltransferase [Bacteroidia bacterium]